MNIEFQARTARAVDPALLAPLEVRFDRHAAPPIRMTYGRSARAEFARDIESDMPTMEEFNLACSGFEDKRYQDLLSLVFNSLTRAQFKNFVAALERIEEQEDPEHSRLLNFMERERPMRDGDAPEGGYPFARGEPEEETPLKWGDALAQGFGGVCAKIRQSFSSRFDEYAMYEQDAAWQDRWLHSEVDTIWSTDPVVDSLAYIPRKKKKDKTDAYYLN